MSDRKLAWQEVHGALVSIAKRRAALDADEARWLRIANAREVWRHVGMRDAVDYLERVLGHGPHVARERMRVALALGELPALEQALATGDLCYSAVRELTRVVIAATEHEWLDAAAGKSLRLVEELVAGKVAGDLPGDPSRADVRPRRVILELTPEAYARWREVRAKLADEHGRRLDDSDTIIAMAAAVLAPSGATGEPTGRAPHQIATTVCSSCDRAWQDGGGAMIEIDPATLDRARCDAQRIGSLDASEPERATQTIPPAMARLIWRRAHGRCQVPGCRSARGLEIHHLVHRADGGQHDSDLMILTCSSCHLAHHRGDLALIGTAKHLAVSRPHAPVASHGGHEIVAVDAGARTLATVTAALVDLGFTRAIACAAVAEGCRAVAPDAPRDQLLRAALRACPRPGQVTVRRRYGSSRA